MQSSIVVKLLSILTLVSEANRPQKFAELVNASGLHKSTMHRLLTLAQENELLQFDEESKSYLLGHKVFGLVRNAYRGHDIQTIALGELMKLHAMVGVNVAIGVPVGCETVYLRVLEAPNSAAALSQPGMREPFHCSASGKALMAFRPDSAIRAHFEDYPFKKFTAHTITTTRKFIKVLDNVRLAGFSTNDREQYDHVVGISAPVFNYLSDPIAVLNIWSPHQRNSLDDLCQWSDELMASAARVTGLIGGSAPSLEFLTHQ